MYAQQYGEQNGRVKKRVNKLQGTGSDEIILLSGFVLIQNSILVASHPDMISDLSFNNVICSLTYGELVKISCRLIEVRLCELMSVLPNSY